jgi:hypothetical protein
VGTKPNSEGDQGGEACCGVLTKRRGRVVNTHHHHHHHHMAIQPSSGPGLLFLGFLNNNLFTGLNC